MRKDVDLKARYMTCMGQATESLASANSRAKRIEWFSIGITVAEAAIAIPLALASGSVALLGFGLDSVIEVASAAALLWFLADVGNQERRDERATVALRIVGALLVALALYILVDSVWTLIHRAGPTPTIAGATLLAVTTVLMFVMTRAKRGVARELDSDAMEADAKQSEFCAYLSIIALAGLALNLAFGLWWADPASAALMVPLIVREGVEALRGVSCRHVAT
jgi:divalent metal cation (Fe/Co/Zn/Cd) transporter